MHRHSTLRRSPTIAVAILVTISSALSAQEPDAPPRKGLGRLLGKAAERMKEEAMKRFDKDGDGKLDEAERAEAMDSLRKNGAEMQAQVRQFMLRRFDADKNGTLDETERKAAFDETMKQLEQNGPMVKNTILGMVKNRFDADGDGRLDDKELGTAREELLKRIVQGVAAADGPAPVDPATRRKEADEKRKKEMLDLFDADKDGTLDEGEREKAKAELKKRFDEFDANLPAPAAK